MKEIREILNRIKTLNKDEKAVLATVVDVDGSSFRLPGAKMLILEDGTTVGTVSGGCLEADVLERAKTVRETGEASVFVYDTTDEEDSVFSLNMGCRGIIRILMEPAESSPVLGFLRDNLENSRDGVIATLISGDEFGSQVIVDSAGIRHSSFSDPALTQSVLAESDRVLKSKCSKLDKTPLGDVFFEYVPLPTKLYIFGAGADAVPLARLVSEMGWKTHVVDHRSAFANSERFPTADMISNPSRDEIGTARLDENSIAVVMTHNYDSDKLILSNLLAKRLKYIGAMGPKGRTERMLSEIEKDDFEITDEMRSKLFGPVGLDIGATTPEGIALAIVAEVQTVLSGRTGGFLREREGSIYGRT